MIFRNALKKFFSLALAAAFAANIFAVDFGGSVKNTTNIKGNSFSSLKLDQIDDLALWLKIPFDKNGNVYLAAEGLYEFEYDQNAEKVYNRLDLDLCKFSAMFKAGQNNLSVNAGRFMYRDLTGIIFSQNADGAYVSYDAQKFNVSAYAAYTGLLNAALVKMLDNPADRFSYDKDAVYELAQKYFVGSASFSLPRVAKTQSLSAQFLGAFKLEGKSYNRLYGTASFGGPIYKTLYYNLSTTFEFQNFDGGSTDVSNLSSAKLTWYLPFKDLTIGGGAVYASGSQGPFENFMGFTKIEAYNSLGEPQYSGLMKFSFSASAKPVKMVLVYAGCDLIVNAATSSMSYKGFQYSLGADWQIFSDVKAGFSMLQYFDNDNSDLNKVQISLNASITF